MADLNVKSETIDKAIDKAIDVISESTKESRTALDLNTSKGINKLFELLKSTPVGIKLDTYIAERPYKLEKAMNEMKSKYIQIPEKNRVEPSSYIALKGINELNYSLDEEYLKEMFENLLVSDMDTRKKSKVLPSYIEIIKQLSKEDAIFLKMLKDKNLTANLPILRLKSVDTKSHFQYISPYILCLKECNFTKIPTIILDNLLRLGLVSIPYDLYIPDIVNYENTFDFVKNNFSCDADRKIEYTKEKLIFTDLGKNFIDICLS